MLNKFNVGDVVRLKSGGPKMVVSNANGPASTVIWVTPNAGNNYGQLSISNECLKKVDENESDHE